MGLPTAVPTVAVAAAAPAPSVVVAESIQSLIAQATAVANSAEASAAVPDAVVAFRPGDTSVAGSGGLTGKASSSLKAEATTVGDDSAADYAKAYANELAGPIVTTGLDLGGGATKISGSTQLLGSAALSASAASSTVAGDSTAAASGTLTTGIGGPLLGQTLNAGDNAAIRALADVALIAKAVAAEGDASASIADTNDSRTVGLGSAIAISNVEIGKNAQIEATAKDGGSATAITVTGSSNTTTNYAAVATSSRKYVEAIDLLDGTLTSGNTLSLKADASSTQVATAQSVGTADNTATGEGSKADAAQGNFVVGISQATLDAGGNLSGLSSNGSLNAMATATSVAGNSRGESGSGTLVAGAYKLAIKVGNDAPSGLVFVGAADTAANATSTKGWSSVQSEGANVAGIYGDVSAPTNSIKVGDDAGLISATATNNILARSNTTSASAGVTPVDPTEAQSYSYLSTNTYGLHNTEVNVGGDATIQGKATTNINAQANIITAEDTTKNAALSKAEIKSAGISLPAAQSIQIGDQGNILAQASSGLISIASSVDSAAGPTMSTDSQVTLVQNGLEMSNPAGSPGKIEIGRIGSISAESLIGRSADPNQVLIAPLISQATSVRDAVDSSLKNSSTAGLTAHGIVGKSSGAPAVFTSIYAGPAGGSITGRSRIAADVSATNVGEFGNVALDSSTLAGDTNNLAGGAGISQMDLYAGSKGNNQITGESVTTINLASSSTNGSTASKGFLASAGIVNTDPGTTSSDKGTAAVAGTIQGISQLSGSSLAQTINGVAQSELSSFNLGISGYNMYISASGGLTSIASTQTSSKSTSVAGSV